LDGWARGANARRTRRDLLRFAGIGGAAAAATACLPQPSAPTRCGEGLTTCSATCVDLQTNDAHCGLCGTACGVGSTCTAGVCSLVCSGGTTMCGSVCKNLSNDPANCNSCGHVCITPHGVSICTAGVCGVGSCNPGFADCDSNPLTGCEVNVMNDPANCGGCGLTCTSLPNASAICSGGSCVTGTCDPGYANCNGLNADGCEVNIDTDPHNCGACGHMCSSANGTAICSGGNCGIVCDPGYVNCDSNPSNGCETHVMGNDNANCGACGNVCTGGHTCIAGVCSGCAATSECSTGQICAGGICQGCTTDLQCGGGMVCDAVTHLCHA
jgi:hypothetical protein